MDMQMMGMAAIASLVALKSHPREKQPEVYGPPKSLRPRYKCGRNEPCPCGSGEKFKRCCLPKGM